MAKANKILRGGCGEHYVAAYLSGAGLIVALTKAGTSAIDLLVASGPDRPPISVQVKAGGPSAHFEFKKHPETKNYWGWRVGADAIGRASDSFWYAFVFVGDWPLDNPAIPTVLFVPSKVVSDSIRNCNPLKEVWYTVYEKEAEQYCGMVGYRKLRTAIG